jgi:hypothetical protein
MAQRQLFAIDERGPNPHSYKVRTARHEAAHAIVAVLAGASITRIDLAEQHFGGGSLTHSTLDDSGILRTAVAGVAQEQLDGERSDSGSNQDIADANRAIRELGLGQDDLDAELRDVSDELGEYQDAIEGLTYELLRSGGSLTGTQVERILAVYGIHR